MQELMSAIPCGHKPMGARLQFSCSERGVLTARVTGSLTRTCASCSQRACVGPRSNTCASAVPVFFFSARNPPRHVRLAWPWLSRDLQRAVE